MKARLVAAAKFLLGLALLIAIVVWLVPGPDERRELAARARLDVVYLLLGLVSTFVASVVTSARWQLMAEDTMGGTRLPYLVYFHSLVLTRVLGQVSSTLVMDLVGRGMALRSAGSQRGLGHAVTQAVLERIFDIVLPVMMLAWAALAWRGGWSQGLALASFAGVCLAFAALAAVLLAPLTRLALASYAALRRLRARVRRQPPIAEPVPEAIPIPTSLAVKIGLLSLARYLSVLLQFWTVAAAVGVAFGFFQIAAATPVGQLAGMAGFTPGALGIQEAGWVGAFKWVGVDAVAIGLFVLSQRLVITAYFSLLSLISWLMLRRTRAPAGPPAT
ncbi:MAG: flippase-like domain-containing protein [Myxococcales bacterium]|nr:flippase-like domain-containing protein [Myxococcales bacterium]